MKNTSLFTMAILSFFCLVGGTVKAQDVLTEKKIALKSLVSVPQFEKDLLKRLVALNRIYRDLKDESKSQNQICKSIRAFKATRGKDTIWPLYEKLMAMENQRIEVRLPNGNLRVDRLAMKLEMADGGTIITYCEDRGLNRVGNRSVILTNLEEYRSQIAGLGNLISEPDIRFDPPSTDQ